MEHTISSFIAQGYVLSNRTPSSATLFKKKEFSILWLVIGLLLCLIPLIIYLIIYASESDKMVQIYLAEAATAPRVAAPPSGQLSSDGRWRWDGLQWVPVPPPPPPAPGSEAEAAGTPHEPTGV
jgi:hypothetical protein